MYYLLILILLANNILWLAAWYHFNKKVLEDRTNEQKRMAFERGELLERIQRPERVIALNNQQDETRWETDTPAEYNKVGAIVMGSEDEDENG